MQSIKEHNLKANHNCIVIMLGICSSVCNLSKNTIWKQITTIFNRMTFTITLYAIYQRTQSESKSQPKIRIKTHYLVCMQSIKEHNLKANHNYIPIGTYTTPSVCNLSKNTIWKQITTCLSVSSWKVPLYAIYQRTQSESKSQQHSGECHLPRICMQSIKEHNLKANHNHIGHLFA